MCRHVMAGCPKLDGVALDGVRPLGLAQASSLGGRFSIGVPLPDRSLLAVRDGSGLFPLYYRTDAARAALRATELLDGDRRLDPWALAIYVATSHMPAPRTLWTAVRKCRAGEATIVSSCGDEERASLRPHFPRTRRDAARMLVEEGVGVAEVDRVARGGALDAEQERRLEAWAEREILAALRREVRGPQQVLLSGGIDSTILARLAAEEGAGSLRTMTFGAAPCDPWSDGVERAAPVARWLGSEHGEIVVTARDFLDSLDDYLGAMGEPSLSAYLYYLVARHLEGSGRWISGLGADEIFLGDPWYLKYVRVSRALALLDRIPQGWRGRLASLLEWSSLTVTKRATLVRTQQPDFRFLYAYCRDNLDLSERLDLLDPRLHPAGFSRDDANFPHGDVAGSGLEAMQEMLLVHEFPDGHGRDVSLFAEAMDLSFPYLSRRVVAAALVTRPASRAGGDKPLLRRIARDVVPADLLAAPKGSFVVPPVAWLRHGIEELVEETLRPERLARRGIWNVPAVVERLRRFRAGRGSPFDVIRVMLLERWMDRHGMVSACSS